MVVDTDRSRRERWIAAIESDLNLEVSSAGDDLMVSISNAQLGAPVDILLINVDQLRLSPTRYWARLHAELPYDMHVVAMTTGNDPNVLEAALAAGITALHPPNIDPSKLVQALRKAALGEVDFNPGLLARAKSLFIEPVERGQVVLGGLVIDLDYETVTRWGRPIPVSLLEFRLLAFLAAHADRIVRPAELLSEVWGDVLGAGGTEDQLRSAVKRLRVKIEPDPHHPRYLISQRGRGYFLADPLSGDPPPGASSRAQ